MNQQPATVLWTWERMGSHAVERRRMGDGGVQAAVVDEAWGRLDVGKTCCRPLELKMEKADDRRTNTMLLPDGLWREEI